jgi:copper chaperone
MPISTVIAPTGFGIELEFALINLHMIVHGAKTSLRYIKTTQRSHTMSQQPTQTFTVTGMTCGHCEKAVTRAVKQVDAQAEVKIDRTANKVEVISTQAREAIAKAIANEGYAVA